MSMGELAERFMYRDVKLQMPRPELWRLPQYDILPVAELVNATETLRVIT